MAHPGRPCYTGDVPSPIASVLCDRRRLPLRRAIPLPADGDAAFALCTVRRLGLQREHGCERRIFHDNAERLDPAEEPYVILQHTIAGRGGFRDQQGERSLDPGTAFLVMVPSATRYWLPRSATWEWIWATFSGAWALELARRVIAAQGHLLQPDPAGPAILGLARLYADCAAGRTPSPLERSQAAQRILLGLLGAQAGTGSGMVERAQALALEQLGDPGLDAAGLARQVGLSRSHFSRRFRRATGEAPHTWLLRQRLAEAAELLLGASLSAAEVARRCGFVSPAHFGAVFRRFHGLPPDAWRKARMRPGDEGMGT